MQNEISSSSSTCAMANQVGARESEIESQSTRALNLKRKEEKKNDRGERTHQIEIG